MGFFGNLFGFVLGWSVGGPIGGLIGLIVANQLDKKRATKEDRIDIFYISFAGLLAAITKADGKIDHREKAIITQQLTTLFPGKSNEILKLYEKALYENFDIDLLLKNVAPFFDHNSRIALIDLMFKVALADEELHHTELNLIKKIARYFKISEYELESIKIQNIRAQQYHYQNKRTRQKPTTTALSKEEAYKILNLQPGASREEIKKAYYNLIKKYHPDKFQHLGEEFIKIAEEKTKIINEAYRLLTS